MLLISCFTNTDTAHEMGNKKNKVIARDWNHMIHHIGTYQIWKTYIVAHGLGS
jgi:hypothetical protein